MASKASNGYGSAFMEQCRAELTYTAEMIEAGEYWLACPAGDRNNLLGSCGLSVQDGVGEVHNMFVVPDAKRSGVGLALWRHLESRVISIGLARLELDADPFAVPFYEAMGMRTIGQSPSGSIPGRMLPRMAKALELV